MGIKDITGERFGRLTAIAYTGRKTRSGHNAIWLFKCDCGNYVERTNSAYYGSKVPSCGCYVKERMSMLNRSHGGRHDRLYLVWLDMRRRCRDPKDSAYPNYGGRGITVCDEWKDYAVFREWAMRTGYDQKAESHVCTLDRIDTNGNYSPDNCRWANSMAQCNNKRNNRLLEYDGRTQTMAQWARECKIHVSTLYNRLLRGWDIERALTVPPQKVRKPGVLAKRR